MINGCIDNCVRPYVSNAGAPASVHANVKQGVNSVTALLQFRMEGAAPDHDQESTSDRRRRGPGEATDGARARETGRLRARARERQGMNSRQQPVGPSSQEVLPTVYCQLRVRQAPGVVRSCLTT